MKKIITVLAAIFITTVSLFAQTKAGRTDTTAHAKFYSCPHHPEITSHHPGKCSICGMDLSLSLKEQMKAEVTKLYTCPMHPDVALTKDGICPKCGKELVEKKQSN